MALSYYFLFYVRYLVYDNSVLVGELEQRAGRLKTHEHTPHTINVT